MNDQIQINKPLTLTLIPEDLNNVLRALEALPFGQVRPTFQRLEAQIVSQMTAPLGPPDEEGRV